MIVTIGSFYKVEIRLEKNINIQSLARFTRNRINVKWDFFKQFSNSVILYLFLHQKYHLAFFISCCTIMSS